MDLDESGGGLGLLDVPNSSVFSNDELNEHDNNNITDRPAKRTRGPYRPRKARIARKRDPAHNVITEDMDEDEIRRTMKRMPQCDLYGKEKMSF